MGDPVQPKQSMLGERDSLGWGNRHVFPKCIKITIEEPRIESGGGSEIMNTSLDIEIPGAHHDGSI